MPDPNNPLNALKKASSISAGPRVPGQDEYGNNIPVSQGVMPFPDVASLPFAGKVGEAISGLAKSAPKILGFSPETEAVMNSMYQKANPVFKGLEEAGQFAGDRTTGSLRPVMPLGASNPEFTPVGEEGLYGLAKAGLRGIEGPVEKAYKNIMSRMGK